MYLYPLLFLIAVLTGCAQHFPRPENGNQEANLNSGKLLFSKTLTAHGVQEGTLPNDVSMQLTGDWKFLITRIQPLVTDHRYRVNSQENLVLKNRQYTAFYQGPSGTKKVIRNEDSIRVFYNQEESFDTDVLQSSALTADAFFVFLLGPMGLVSRYPEFIQLADTVEDGQRYHRLYAKLTPGFGISKEDEIILWIHSETKLTYRVQITLEGYKTTKGAHVDVSYLDYQKINNYILPSSFNERVLAPIRINAHDWRTSDIKINKKTYSKQ